MNPTLGTCYDFRNDSGVTVPPFGLFLAREVVKRKSDDRLFLKAEKPVAADVVHLYRNGLASVAPGSFGCGLLAEICEVAYDPADGTPDVGQPWGIKPGSADTCKLRKGYGGWEVLRKPDDPQREFVLVRRMASHRLTGLLAANMNAPSNGWTGATDEDVTLYQPTRTDTGTPIDWAASSPTITLKDVTNRDTTFSRNSSTMVSVEWIAGEWRIYWSAC